jgi:hypothetical protein
MSFFKNQGQEGKTYPAWGLVPVGGVGDRKGVKEGECGRNFMYLCATFDTVLRRIKENDGGGGFD